MRVRVLETQRRPRKTRAGLTLIEVCLAMGVVATVLLASAGAFSSSLSAVERSGRLTNGSIFLDTVMQDLSAQPYGSLLAMNGNQFFDQATQATSQYAVDLTVFLAQVDLLRIEAALIDLGSGQEMGRVITFRSRR